MKINILSLVIAGMATSCAFHSGNISTGSTIDCPLKDVVTGESSTIKILGFGGLDKNGLILDAKRDLYDKYKYSKNIKLTNFSVDFKTTFIFFYSSTKATVSADLYDCENSLTNDNRNDIKPMIGGLMSGDSVTYENNGYYSGVLNNHSNKDKCVITYKSTNGKSITEKVKLNLIYKTSTHPDNKTYFGYNIGESAFIEVFVMNSKTKVVKPCKIVGLNSRRLLVTYTKDDGQERLLSVDKSLIKK